MTITLYEYVQSELIKKGFNEFVDRDGNLVFFQTESQFLTKIFSYDEEVSSIVDRLFTGVSLTKYEHDMHFKKTFLYKFLNRNINRQTIEAFRVELLTTFLMNQSYIDTVYTNLELYLTQTGTSDSQDQSQNEETNHQTNISNNRQTNNQTSKETNDGTTTTDNREADATLPQSNVHLDLDSTVMTTADSNRIARNKQLNQQLNNGESSGETIGENDSIASGKNTGENSSSSFSESKSYRLDELFKRQGIEENLFNVFDRKCFKQVW